MEVLVLDPGRGLCFLDGKVHEVRLNLDEPIACRIRQLLEANSGTAFLKLALDESGRGKVVAVR
ncbi:MAG: hypothetical protein H0Z37_06475 [Firmicutes bacterium]|nr:hypothetical protein [Bacillota bacterium]